MRPLRYKQQQILSQRRTQTLVSEHTAHNYKVRIADLEQLLFEIRYELSKYLTMSPKETIIGGIRNIIQASILNEDMAKQATSLWSKHHEDTREVG